MRKIKKEIIRCNEKVEMRGEKWARIDKKKEIREKKEVMKRERWEEREKRKR